MTDERPAALAAILQSPLRPTTWEGRDEALVDWEALSDKLRQVAIAEAAAILAALEAAGWTLVRAEAATLDVERLARALARTYGTRFFTATDADWRSDADYLAREYRDGGAA